jgi:hypothetical protein
MNHWMPRLRRLYRKILLRLHPYKTLDDAYLTRMRSSIGGAPMLHDGNVYSFDYALRRLPTEGAVLEIGAFAGMSTNVLAELMRRHCPQRTLFSCDPWVFEGYQDQQRPHDHAYLNSFEGAAHISRAAYTAFVRESFVRNTRLFSGDRLPYACPLRSEDFFRAWAAGERVHDVFERKAQLGGPLAFVYVDGDHGYEAALQDALSALEHLSPGGFLLLDDSADYWDFGSVRVAQALTKHPNLELVHKNPNYLFRVIA